MKIFPSPPFFQPNASTGFIGTACLIGGLLASFPSLAEDWRINQKDYNAFLCYQAKVPAACNAPRFIGHYPNKPACNSARTSGRMATDSKWLSNTFCDRIDTPPSAPAVSMPAPPQIPATPPQNPDFDDENAALVASLKGIDPSPATPEIKPPVTKPNRALRDLDCSAYWALFAAKQADEGARSASEKSAQAERIGKNDCPPAKQGDLPQPHPVIDKDLSPSQALTYQEIIEAAQAIRTRFVQNHEELAGARRQQERLQKELARVKQKAFDGQNPETARAIERLERQMAALDQSVGNLEAEQKKLRDDLDVLQHRYETALSENRGKAAKKTSPATETP